MRTSSYLLAGAAILVGAPAVAGFAGPAALPSISSNRVASCASLNMQFPFGGKSNAAPPPPSGKGGPSGLAPVPGLVLITFQPSGLQVNARPGERIGDAASRIGLDVPYGCREGVCGTCEAKMSQSNGMKNDIRCCKDTVPKSNMVAPDREKMWGDLKGGKKSVSELRGAPEALTITLSNPGLALKRQRSWEDVKGAMAKNTNQWLDPNYKAPRKGGPPAPPPQEEKKKNFFGF
ncbi:hypothetical protein T484DRAFT_1953144 [Baffinella frigidus]|nr:hypothetical protein T484DRAFT_1953144 [Cryptophyta sp. CCMP2293]